MIDTVPMRAALGFAATICASSLAIEARAQDASPWQRDGHSAVRLLAGSRSGTVLLGGIKRLREGRTERGIPILNKLPYISRLFKNVGIGRETQSLMMMVTPRIIIQEEEEQKLGIHQKCQYERSLRGNMPVI